MQRQPAECSKAELDDFENLVKIGGEVNPNGLRDRIKNAFLLVWVSAGVGNVVGVAALKRPNENYRSSVFKKACSKEKPSLYEAELGWIFVKEEFRGKSVATQLINEILSAKVLTTIYATAREKNDSILSILKRLGFKQNGNAYPSNEGHYSVVLYTKKA